MVYQTIKSDMCPGHRFADRSPAEFHPYVLAMPYMYKTGTFALAMRHDPVVSGLRKPLSMDEQSPHVLQKKFDRQRLIRLAAAVHSKMKFCPFKYDVLVKKNKKIAFTIRYSQVVSLPSTDRT
jgi:hypothetical protein